MTEIKRDIVEWRERPASYYPILSCGHNPLQYDGGLSLEKQKEQEGKQFRCYECEQDAEKIQRLKNQLAELEPKPTSIV